MKGKSTKVLLCMIMAIMLIACGNEAADTSVVDSYVAESDAQESISGETGSPETEILEECSTEASELSSLQEETEGSITETQEAIESQESSVKPEETKASEEASEQEETLETSEVQKPVLEVPKESQVPKEPQQSQESSAPSKQPESTTPSQSVQTTPTTNIVPATPTTHTCTWDGGNETTPATCKTTGVMTYSCSCGNTRTETIPVTDNHTMVTESKAASCTDAGYKKVYCSICGKVESEETYAATGHKMEEWWYSEPDCTAPGESHTSFCRNEGCDYFEDLPEGALGHDSDDGVVFYEGDCSSNAMVEYHCERCGAYMGEGEVPSLHPDDHYWVIDKDTGIEFCVNGCGAVR